MDNNVQSNPNGLDKCSELLTILAKILGKPKEQLRSHLILVAHLAAFSQV